MVSILALLTVLLPAMLCLSAIIAFAQEKERAERLKWRAFALCIGALERFTRRARGDVVIEAVILATERPAGVPEQLEQLVQKRTQEIGSPKAKLLPSQGQPKRLNKPK
jgi:hypothetical protein